MNTKERGRDNGVVLRWQYILCVLLGYCVVVTALSLASSRIQINTGLPPDIKEPEMWRVSKGTRISTPMISHKRHKDIIISHYDSAVEVCTHCELLRTLPYIVAHIAANLLGRPSHRTT